MTVGQAVEEQRYTGELPEDRVKFPEIPGGADHSAAQPFIARRISRLSIRVERQLPFQLDALDFRKVLDRILDDLARVTNHAPQVDMQPLILRAPVFASAEVIFQRRQTQKDIDKVPLASTLSLGLRSRQRSQGLTRKARGIYHGTVLRRGAILAISDGESRAVVVGQASDSFLEPGKF